MRGIAKGLHTGIHIRKTPILAVLSAAIEGIGLRLPAFLVFVITRRIEIIIDMQAVKGVLGHQFGGNFSQERMCAGQGRIQIVAAGILFHQLRMRLHRAQGSMGLSGRPDTVRIDPGMDFKAQLVGFFYRKGRGVITRIDAFRSGEHAAPGQQFRRPQGVHIGTDLEENNVASGIGNALQVLCQFCLLGRGVQLCLGPVCTRNGGQPGTPEFVRQHHLVCRGVEFVHSLIRVSGRRLRYWRFGLGRRCRLGGIVLLAAGESHGQRHGTE